jgi:hypothetical protein
VDGAADQFARLSVRPELLRQELLAALPSPGAPVVKRRVVETPCLLAEAPGVAAAWVRKTRKTGLPVDAGRSNPLRDAARTLK